MPATMTATKARTDRSPVRVSQRELIELSGDARALTLKTIRVRARKGGDYLSALRGRGMEFDEARPYQPGDDPRNIDWRVTARTGKPYTKVFREERERPVMFLLDLRSSMHFATQGVYKSVHAARIAAMIAWAAEQHGDRVGGFLFAEDFHRQLRPRLGRSAVLRLIHETTGAPVWEPSPSTVDRATTAATMALARFRNVEKSGSLVVLVTDGRNFDTDALRHLEQIGRNNDVLIFYVYDPVEASLPPPGRYQILAGNLVRTIATDHAKARLEYERQFAERRSGISELARHHGMRFFELSTAGDPLALLRGALGRHLG